MNEVSDKMTKWQAYRRNYVQILRLGAPILLGQLGMIVVGFADTMMIGHYSIDSLSAASFVNSVFNLSILICIGFTYGLTPLIGALYSIKRNDDIGATLRRGVKINIAVALTITVAMFVMYLNVDRMGQPENLLPLIRPYFLIYLAGILPISLFQCFAQWAYAINSTKMPMWIVLGANLFNVIGNWLLIYGVGPFPELGLVGAGISTLIARWIGPVAILLIFLKGSRYRCYHDGFFRKTGLGEPTKRILRTSFPISLQLGFETASFTVAGVMAGWLGEMQLAAMQIIVVVGSLGFCIYYGMGSAVSVLVANASTKGGPSAMRRVAMAGYHIHIFLALMASCIFALFGHELISIFTSDETVEAMTITLIFPLILYQLGDATQVNFANALRGTANVVPMLWIALTAYVIIGIPATYLLGFILGMDIYGIVLSFSVSLFTAAALFLYFFLRTTRVRVNSEK